MEWLVKYCNGVRSSVEYYNGGTATSSFLLAFYHAVVVDDIMGAMMTKNTDR